jgi:hypothetical protein
VVDIEGVSATLDYEPGESTSGLFGGKSISTVTQAPALGASHQTAGPASSPT